MSTANEDLPIPLNPASRRLESIDLLRGLLMLLMAIDHTRDYFGASSNLLDPTDPARSWPALFATRWITHLCAPGFIALAGASVYLQRQRGKTAGQTAKLLITRGLWLMFLEITLVDFGWSFTIAPVLQVIWAVAVCMIFLGLLQRLSPRAIGLIGALIVLLHNLLDPIKAAHFGRAALLWELIHEEGLILIGGKVFGVVAYPIVPWIGVICLGYAFGQVALFDPPRRPRFAATLGTSFLLAFAFLRILHGYGDHDSFQHLATWAQTVMSFLYVEKYPPSLHYLLATLGVNLLLYAFFDLAVSRHWLPRARAMAETYGRVPFFYYVLHIYLLHTAALVLTAANGLDWRFWLRPASVFANHLAGWGYSLPGVYLIWFLTVAVLYLPCLWFSRLKTRRRDWWLSYL